MSFAGRDKGVIADLVSPGPRIKIAAQTEKEIQKMR
jgi:hypothetical protein